eukprot:962807_1
MARKRGHSGVVALIESFVRDTKKRFNLDVLVPPDKSDSQLGMSPVTSRNSSTTVSGLAAYGLTAFDLTAAGSTASRLTASESSASGPTSTGLTASNVVVSDFVRYLSNASDLAVSNLTTSDAYVEAINPNISAGMSSLLVATSSGLSTSGSTASGLAAVVSTASGLTASQSVDFSEEGGERLKPIRPNMNLDSDADDIGTNRKIRLNMRQSFTTSNYSKRTSDNVSASLETKTRGTSFECVCSDLDGNVYFWSKEKSISIQHTDNSVETFTPDLRTSTTQLQGVLGMAFVGGALYLTTFDSHRIFKLSFESKAITVWIGGSDAGFQDGHDALFRRPQGLAVDAGGNVYVADRGNFAVRKVEPDGKVSTLYSFNDQAGQKFSVISLCVGSGDYSDFLFACGPHQIFAFELTNLRNIRVLCGQKEGGYMDGSFEDCKFDFPGELMAVPGGKLIVVDSKNNCVRCVDIARKSVFTLLGSGRRETVD